MWNDILLGLLYTAPLWLLAAWAAPGTYRELKGKNKH
jgi:hypothetical protein